MEIRQGIKDYSDWPTIPQLYVKGEFVGGSDIMMEMWEAGELRQLVDDIPARAEGVEHAPPRRRAAFRFIASLPQLSGEASDRRAGPSRKACQRARARA